VPAHPRRRRSTDVPPGEEDPVSFAVSRRDSDVLAVVQEAVAHRQTLLAYQPIVRATDGHPGLYEGLIRVLDSTGRAIPAREFMPQLEETEAGREIDVQALSMGVQTLRAHPDLRLSINMSARSIGYRPWQDCLRRALNASPTLGERLVLEISEESAMTVPELVARFMSELHSAGVCFALDDFGSGRSAIRHFRDFDFDMVKIAGRFVRGLSRHPDNRALCGALISVARHFEMLVVAKSVENAPDAEATRALGADCLQGYYFAAPTTRPDWMTRKSQGSVA
jgi:EAL domain-containing protein (putative c-di-GMP-specific phosphodiesterase class I)